MIRPEDYREMTNYLNSLSAATWRGIINAYAFGGDERVVKHLRREDPSAIMLWSDEELLEYLASRELSSDDFLTIRERS